MSRSGYTDEIDDRWAFIRYRGAVNSALSGARGQAALIEILAALDAMPVKELITESLVTADGDYCTLGALGAARGMDMSQIDADDWGAVAKAFGIAPAMVREIVFMNDECKDDFILVEVEVCGPMRPRFPEWGCHRRTVTVFDAAAGRKRWVAMRQWVASQIKRQKKEASR